MASKPRHFATLPCAAALLALAAGGVRADDVPQRIVSFNLCADQLVLALADPQQIAGLSPYATDAAVSVMADRATRHPAVPWQAESTLPLKPDLVILGSTDRPATREMLARLRIPLAGIDLIADIDTAREQVQAVARLVGHPERGEALVAEIDAARARLAAAPRPRGHTALLVGHGGYAAGPASLAAALLAETGLRPPPGAPPGYGGFVALESLIQLKPDYLFVASNIEQPVDQGSVFFTHPAMRMMYPRWKRIPLPGRYTLCGGPALVEALDYMTGVLTRLAARGR